MYTLDSLIISPSQTSAADKQAWLEARGKSSAPTFAPDRTYKAPPPNIGQIVDEEANRWQPATNGDALIALIDLESAAWQSALARDKNNPSGFGAEDDDPYNKAHTFPDARRAIEATNAKLRNYALGVGEWSPLDTRFTKIPVAWLGTTRRVRDFGNGRYATDPHYAGKLLDRMNALLAFVEAQPESLTPPSGWTPPETVQRLLPRDASNTPQRTMDWQYVTVHNTGNSAPTANALMHAAWLESLAKRGASEPSWHFTVDDTRVVQHLGIEQAAYHASDGDGQGNFGSLGYELCEIGNQDRVLWNAGWHMAQRLRSRGKDTSWMLQHHDWARDKKNCPRLLRANDGAGWKKLLAIVEHFLTGTPDDELMVEGVPICDGFRDHFVEVGGAVWPVDPVKGGIVVFGLPLAPEYPTAVGSAQRFERYVMEWHRDNAPPFDIIGTIRGQKMPEKQS